MNVIGDSICVLRVKVEVENGFAQDVAEKIGALKGAVKRGDFDENYPISLVEKVKTLSEKITNVEISGPRSAIAIPLRFIKTFAPESGVAFSSKLGDGGCAKLIDKFLKDWGVINAAQIAEKSDCAVEFKCVSPDGELSETIVKKSSSKAFKHLFDLLEIENRLGVKFDAILLNRPRVGFAKALDELHKRPNSLVSLVIHDFSKYQHAADYLEYAKRSNFVFITAEDGGAVMRPTMKELGVASRDELGEKIVNLTSPDAPKKMFVLPPSPKAVGKDKVATFYQTGLAPVIVEIPDKVRQKTKTAWLNGACVALAVKDWSKRKQGAPFKLSGHLPATQTDLENFANWAVNMAYFGYPRADFEPTQNLIIK